MAPPFSAKRECRRCGWVRCWPRIGPPAPDISESASSDRLELEQTDARARTLGRAALANEPSGPLPPLLSSPTLPRLTSVDLRNWFDDEDLGVCPNCGQRQ